MIRFLSPAKNHFLIKKCKFKLNFKDFKSNKSIKGSVYGANSAEFKDWNPPPTTIMSNGVDLPFNFRFETICGYNFIIVSQLEILIVVGV